MKIHHILTYTGLFIAATQISSAAVVLSQLTNNSFEDPALADGALVYDAPGFTDSGGTTLRVYDAAPSWFTSGTAADGENALWLAGGSWITQEFKGSIDGGPEQVLGAALDGETISITFSAGWQVGITGTIFVGYQYYGTDNAYHNFGTYYTTVAKPGSPAANTVYLRDFGMQAGDWLEQTLEIDVAAPDYQSNLQFMVLGTTSYGWIDNIQLAVVPEPSAYGVIAGFLALGWVMLRRRA